MCRLYKLYLRWKWIIWYDYLHDLFYVFEVCSWCGGHGLELRGYGDVQDCRECLGCGRFRKSRWRRDA